jgi:hypothetical protein
MSSFRGLAAAVDRIDDDGVVLASSSSVDFGMFLLFLLSVGDRSNWYYKSGHHWESSHLAAQVRLRPGSGQAAAKFRVSLRRSSRKIKCNIPYVENILILSIGSFFGGFACFAMIKYSPKLYNHIYLKAKLPKSSENALTVAYGTIPTYEPNLVRVLYWP